MVVFGFSVLGWKYPFCANLYTIQNLYTVSLLGKFDPQNQNCQFRRKFGIETNANMQKSMVMFSFSNFDRKYPIQNSMLAFTFSIFDWKYPFWANLSQNSKLFVQSKI